MRIEDLIKEPGEWLRGTGPEGDIVISSRIRLARNVQGFPFLTRADAKERARVEAFIRGKLEGNRTVPKLHYFPLAELSAVDRLVLVERHLISREHATSEQNAGVAIAKDECVSVMVNEEDHLRIQVIRSGFLAAETWDQASQVDDAIGKKVPFSFHPEFGFLTACPTNVGTGMRISVLLHLPALVLTKQIEKVFHALGRITFTVRGLYGEGTQASGDFYQISNQVTLGKAEQDLVQDMRNVVPEIVRFERTWRKRLMDENRRKLEDRIWRAWAVLRHARWITSEETLEYLSFVRLGVHLGVLQGVELGTVNELFVFSQPGHLQKTMNRALEAGDRDAARADWIRKRLGAE